MARRTPARKRGRPPKFGKPGRFVAITLPDEVVRGLRKLHPDLAWAIVALFEQAASGRRLQRPSPPDDELVTIAGRQSLIVVNKDVFRDLPGVNIIPLHDRRAFLALQPGRGMSDLELAVIDRLASARVDARERQALTRLRDDLRKWRRDRTLRCETRAIIVVERVKPGSRR